MPTRLLVGGLFLRLVKTLYGCMLTWTDEVISGDVLAALQHAELKEMGVGSVGHRLTILKAVYEIKVKQNVPIDPDDYVPLCKRPSLSSDLCSHYQLRTHRDRKRPPRKRTLPRSSGWSRCATSGYTRPSPSCGTSEKT
jgi:hypothetical protein